MRGNSSLVRLAVCVVVGLGVALVSPAEVRLVAGWIATAGLFGLWTWLVVACMDGAATRTHATREDPGHLATTLVLVVASLASLGGVAALLAASPNQQGSVLEAVLGAAAVFGSWFVVHTVFALHYARLFYTGPGDAIDFNGEDAPDYQDFAYLAFTLGMTYQVSDTALQSRAIRRAALKHSLLSFLLGAVVIACTINLVAQLASS